MSIYQLVKIKNDLYIDRNDTLRAIYRPFMVVCADLIQVKPNGTYLSQRVLFECLIVIPAQAGIEEKGTEGFKFIPSVPFFVLG